MIDFIKIKVKAGDGGKGCVAWRHEKFYANGGPFGGDGGRGGHVYIEVDTNETTLTKLRFTRSVKAGNGEPGKIKKMHGADGEDVFELVPIAELPDGLPAVRPWKIYCIKSTHTDIGLHNYQYIQRHESVKVLRNAAALVDADTRADDDPSLVA